MEDGHVDTVVEEKININSIFTLFSNLTGEKNQNPKYCSELLKKLHGDRFLIGSTSNFTYSIKRIVKGLGSSRIHSQCGCFAALTCILKYKGCTVTDVLNVLDKELKSIQGATKNEIGALHTTDVLTCGSIIHSGVFANETPEIQHMILKKLIEAGKKKSYLFIIASRFLVDAINSVDQPIFKRILWPIYKDEILNNVNDFNINHYYLLLICMKSSPKIVSKFLRKKSYSDSIVLEKIVDFIFKNCIKCSHPAIEIAVQLLCNNENLLPQIWSHCVEEYGKINNLKDDLLITFFYHIVVNLDKAEILPALLTPKFVDILIRVLSFKKTKAPKNNNCSIKAQSALTAAAVLLKSEETVDETRLNTILKLLLYPANMKFEMKTGTKFVQCLVNQLNSNSVRHLLDIYKKIITEDLKKVCNEEGSEESWTSKEKQIALINFVKTINHPAIKSDISLKLELIKFIFEIGFVKELEFSPEMEKFVRESFYKAIMLHMSSLKDLVILLDDLADHVNLHIGNKNLKVSSNVINWWEKQFSVLQKLKADLNNKFFIAVHVLLIYMGFQLFLDEKLAIGGIEELLSCYAHLNQVHKKKKSGGKSKSEINQNYDSTAEEPHWTEVTVDLILSLLSRENKLWRHVISCIFPQVIVHATSAALHQIIDALDPKSQKEILEPLNSDESNTESPSEEDSESNLTDSELSQFEDGDGEEKANDQLRMAVREALGYSAALTDDESIDMDAMSEEEQKKLNENLAQAFKMFKGSSRGKRKKHTREDEALMHFRLRVLDLIEIYLAHGPDMGGCLDLILPLLELLEFAIKNEHQVPLQKRIDSVIKNLSAVKNFTGSEGISESTIKDLFSSVTGKKEISALVFVEMSSRIADCTSFLVRCSQCLKADNENKESDMVLADEYNVLLEAFIQTRDFRLPMSMFQSVLKMTWRGNFLLVKTLFHFLSVPTIRIFKKLKILDLLQLFYKNEKLHSSFGERYQFELIDIETTFINNFSALLLEYKKNESTSTKKMYAAFLSNLIVLMKIIRCNTKRHRKNAVTHPPWQNLISVMAQIASIENNKRTKCQLTSLADLFGLTLPLSSQREEKGTEDHVCPRENSEEPLLKGNRKRKLSNVKRRLKKESRKLREEISSNGLKVFKFSSVANHSLPYSEQIEA